MLPTSLVLAFWTTCSFFSFLLANYIGTFAISGPKSCFKFALPVTVTTTVMKMTYPGFSDGDGDQSLTFLCKKIKSFAPYYGMMKVCYHAVPF
jgi:hypothetical protein